MLFLTESDVLALLPMDTAIVRVESAFHAQNGGEATNQSRRRLFLPQMSLHTMAAVLPGESLAGVKIYTVSRGVARFVVLLYDSQSGDLLAFMEADHLGRLRTGAATGVATKYLSREDASTAGVIGSGRQARTQLLAISRVRTLRAARVYSRDAGRRSRFAQEMRERLGIEVEPVESAEAAARFGDIVVTATSSKEPVISGDWLKPGAHVNAIGANMQNRREVDDALLDRADVIAVDSVAQAHIEAGDLIQGFELAPAQWERVAEMWEIIADRRPGRKSADDITLFKSTGIALWDVVAAGEVYRRAMELGRGQQIALSSVMS